MFMSRPILLQTLAIIPVALANLMTGISLGWLPPILQKHINSNGDFSLTDDDCSWMVSLQYLGFFAGCLLLATIVDTFGRNAVIALSAITVLLSWIGVVLTRTAILHLLIRFVAGISMGLSTTIMSIYIGENSSPHVRGVFGSGTALFVDGGMLLACILATYYSYETTAYIFVAISLMNLSSIAFLREPAQHLLAKGRESEAENQFFSLRGRSENSAKEFDDLKSNFACEKPKFSFSFIFNRYFQITCATSTFLYMTGFPAVAALVSILLPPTKQFSSNELAILFELFQLIGAVISPFIIDCFGRRILWILSAILTAISHFFTAGLYFAREKGFEVPNNEWLLFASITSYAAIFSIAMYPLAILARAELLPQGLRTTGTCISSILNSLTGAMVGHSFLWISANFGIHMNFICYAVFSLIILILCYFYLPETKGMSLTEIEKMLENPCKTAGQQLST